MTAPLCYWTSAVCRSPGCSHVLPESGLKGPARVCLVVSAGTGARASLHPGGPGGMPLTCAVATTPRGSRGEALPQLQNLSHRVCKSYTFKRPSPGAGTAWKRPSPARTDSAGLCVPWLLPWPSPCLGRPLYHHGRCTRPPTVTTVSISDMRRIRVFGTNRSI